MNDDKLIQEVIRIVGEVCATFGDQVKDMSMFKAAQYLPAACSEEDKIAA